nr:hypothetical protein [Neorhizobium sp. T7_12]
MLLVGVDREEARRRVQPKVNAMIASWRQVPGLMHKQSRL